MCIDKTDPHAHQLVPPDKEKELIQSHNWSHREGMKKGKKFVSVFDVTTGQLTDYERMADHLLIEEQLFQMAAAPPKVCNPNRGINDDHGYDFADLRLRMGRRFFSVPPSLARRLLLSRAIRASSPRRTNAVFSLRPVKRDAFSKISSSIFRVVLICINMHHSYIFVNVKCSPPLLLFVENLLDKDGKKQDPTPFLLKRGMRVITC